MTEPMGARVAIDIANGTVATTAQRKREAWQYLHDTRLGYNLGGFYADTLRSMIADGMIEKGNVRDE